MAIPMRLADTTQAHLEQLVADREQEGPHLDFKRELPVNWDAGAKHDFFADASAFANAGGGDLVYGIAEDAHGLAASLVPHCRKLAENVHRKSNASADVGSVAIDLHERLALGMVPALIRSGGFLSNLHICNAAGRWLGFSP